jgi:hypothetical protein
MSVRLAAVIVLGCLYAGVQAQTPVPSLTRQQRDLLKAIVSAVDAASSQPQMPESKWQLHVLRASDGSHYVAFSVAPGAVMLNERPILMYVRLATAAAGGVMTVTERSVVREWLEGSRTDPRLLPRRGGMAIGEMPVMGAGGINTRGAAAAGSSDLQTMAMQRERARQRKEDEDRQRRESLESAAATPNDQFPFEDFEAGLPGRFADGTRVIQRALTAGPGNYELSIAWAELDQPAAKATVHVARHTLQLAPARNEFGVSSVIVADQIGVRAVPYSAAEQRAHPYSIGPTEIVPARDNVFTPDERLAAAFQIMNPAPDAAGKPDVVVNLRIARINGTREEPVASLSPLVYNAASLPADFDVRLGHPLIAALAVPLATIPRGAHRLLITAEDRIAKEVVSSRAEFIVTGSAASLLAEAPPLGPRFDVARALDSSIVHTLLDRVTPAAPSAALARALSTARSGRYADLLIEDRVATEEQGLRSMLTGLALLSLGDLGAISQFERAQAERVDTGVIDYFIGVARAMQNRDAEAIQRWTAARSSGLSGPTAGVLAEAHLRRREFAQAAAIVGDTNTALAPALAKSKAAARIGEGRHGDALIILDTVLAKSPEDLDARWLLVHALYAGVVMTPGSPRERFLAEAQRYIDAKGRNAALAAEWLAQITKSK